jgi:RNA polymerase sigma-70 factor (ECF subfamily)
MSAREPSDADLARQAARGNDRAFAALVRRHQDSLYRLLRRYLGTPEAAQEATHEAFVAAWGALTRYDPARPFGAWLRSIAINKARDHGRRSKIRRLLFKAPSREDAPAWPDPAPLADEAIAERERLAALDKAIAELPEGLKGPLLLTVFEGLSHKEAGEVLGLTAKGVETRVYRARRLLSERLGGFEDEA